MPKIPQSRIKDINNMSFQKVIYGNIVNKVIYGNIVNMMLKIIKHPIYNTSRNRKIYVIKLSFAIKLS